METDDIKSEREEHLRRAEKMEAVGLLARGVAHDINNILSGVLGFTSYLKAKAAKDSDLFRDLGLIEESGNRAADLSRQLFMMARRRHASREQVPVNDAIGDALADIRKRVPPNVTLEAGLSPDLPVVTGDRQQITHAVLNLCQHALDAMAEEGGTLTVRAEGRALTARERAILVDAREGVYVCVSVRDTGRGLTAEARVHVFDPFYLSKISTGGAGLLLPIVYGVAANHYGDVSVDSVIHGPDHGTTFRLYLPAAQVADAGEGVAPSKQGGTETILVVDDEPMVRKMLSDVLKARGYRTLMAHSGEEAVDLYQRKRGAVDLVLLDLVMPGMGGEEAFHALHEMDPAVRVLLTTVSSQEELGERLITQGALGAVYKPYKSDVLLSAIRKALAK
jgi:two-component system, cell cycle sensor histidine kinase and response regulator CckA